MIITKRRQFKLYVKLLLKLVLIAIVLWLIIFNIYALTYKFNSNNNKNQIKNEENNQIEQLAQSAHKKDEASSNNAKKDAMVPAKIIDSKTLEFFKQIQRPKYEINCQRLIEWDESESQKTKRLLYKLRSADHESINSNNNVLDDFSKKIPLLDDSNFIFDKSKCSLFKELRGYDSHAVHDFELKFPLAFVILTYNNVEQFERLLRTIYRPQNVYCIHIDSKSPKEVHQAIKSIVDCFDNVFIATKLERIVYASFSRLMADINCMNDLTRVKQDHPNLVDKKFRTDWKYLLNMASTEFPLRTNYEMTRILNMFNGANDIEVIRNIPKNRVSNVWKIKRNPNTSVDYMVMTKSVKTAVPHNYTIVKGIAYCSFSRKFVDYVLTNVYAKNLLNWAKDTYSPDEWYWSTLQYNTQFNPPGGFRDDRFTTIPTRSRFIGWKPSYNCKGEFRHNICVFSIGDLPELVTRNEFFLNKFLLEYDPISYQCFEEWLNNKVSVHQTVNIVNYCRLIFVLPYSVHSSCSNLIDAA